MGRLGPTELLIILAIVVLLFGAKQIPQLARSLGQGIKEFRTSVKTGAQDESEEDNATETQNSV